MDLRHEFTVPAPIDQTWSAFNDIESVAVCFPGAKVTAVEGDTFTRNRQGQARPDRTDLQRHRHLRGEGRVRSTGW